MRRLVCIRLDADTPICCSEGLENISRLADTEQFNYTTFVNPGRALDRRISMGFRRGLCQPATTARKLSSLHKLGLGNLARLAFTNPPAFPGYAASIRDVIQSGHDVGLHGGLNHGTWQHSAHHWSQDMVAAAVDAGLEAFREADLPRPLTFASPGWVSPASLPSVLESRGFTCMADIHGPGSRFLSKATGATGLVNIRTALTGEPGGVGYLEHLAASGFDEKQRRHRIERDLENSGEHVMMYDHPFFVGREGLPLLREFVHDVRALGCDIVPLSRILHQLGHVRSNSQAG